MDINFLGGGGCGFAHRNIAGQQIKGLAREDLLAQRAETIAALEVLHQLVDRDLVARRHLEDAVRDVLFGDLDLFLLGDAKEQEVRADAILRALLGGADEFILVFTSCMKN